MKKAIAVFLLIAFAFSLSACSKTPGEPKDPRFADEVLTNEAKILCAVADAYYNRRPYIQYDQLAMNRISRTNNRSEFVVPEMATAQRIVHMDCGVFVRNVYLNAFDYTIPTAEDILAADYPMPEARPFYWVGDHDVTDTEKEEQKQKFIGTLAPGDVLYYNYVSNNHVMLYTGNGKIIHCSYSTGGGDYDYSAKTDKTETDGALFLTDIDEVFEKRDLFAKQNEVCLFRPFALGLTATQSAEIRAEKLEDIIITKTTSCPDGYSVNPGGEVEIEVVLRNTRPTAVTLNMTDEAPKGTTTADTLSQTVKIAANDSTTVKYKLKVDNDASLCGKIIPCNYTKIEGMPINDTPILVGNTLTADQQKTITANGKTVAATKADELVGGIYRLIGSDVSGMTAADILPDVFWSYTECMEAGYTGLPMEAGPLDATLAKKVMVSTLYGGQGCTTGSTLAGIRTRGVTEMNLVVGDILCFNETGKADAERTYVYIGDKTVLTADNGKVETESVTTVLDRLFGQHCFCVVRPSFENN